MSQLDLRIPIKKFSDSGEVTGWAALSTDDEGNPVVDWHGDYIPIDELKNAAHQLMLDGGTGKAGEMHADRVGDIVESMVVDKAKAQALGLGDVEGWIVTLKILDETTRDRIRSGELRELSISGTAVKKSVAGVNVLTKMTVDEISVVDEGASGNENVSPRIVIAKRRDASWLLKIKSFFSKQEMSPMRTPEEILAGLPAEDAKVIMDAMEAMKAAIPAPEPVAEPAPDVEMNKAEDEEEPEPTEKEEELKEELAKAKKRLTALEDDKESARFTKMASAIPCVAGNSTAKIAKLLHSASKGMKPSEFAEIYKLLEDHNNKIAESSFFKNSGSPMPGDDISGADKLDTIAKTKAEAKGITYQRAYVEAAKENPDLVRS